MKPQEANVIRTRGLTERRSIGAFYTPDALGQLIADWAIRSPTDTILEPSFGGCGLLTAAARRLAALGCGEPHRQLFGCDTDPVAFEHLRTAFGAQQIPPGLVKDDFLSCSKVVGWPTTITAIIANPPYIRHHLLSDAQRELIKSKPGAITGLGRRAGLWLHFLSRAIAHLAWGGRMAWVLPGAFMQADYAEPARAFLADNFHRSSAFVIHDRLFLDEGTDEETVVLLADGLRPMPKMGRLEVGDVQSLSELAELVTAWDNGVWTGESATTPAARMGWDKQARSLFRSLELSHSARKLGDVAKAMIGIVTGDNSFFVLSREKVHAAEMLEEDCSPVLAKFRAARGLSFSRADHVGYLDKGERGLLVSSRGREDNHRINGYLSTFDEQKRRTVSTFRKRPCWSMTCDPHLPDAFFPVMNHSGPRLVLNELGCTSTNTVHRIFFKPETTAADRKLVAISVLSTFSQLSAELAGRRYGSGVLKHEPRDVHEIKILMPTRRAIDVDRAFIQIDTCLRRGDLASASRLADQFVLREALPALPRGALIKLSETLEHVRSRRRPLRQAKRTLKPTDPPTSS